MKAVWNGATLAESNDTIVVEGNHYFPRSAIHPEFFKPSNHHTICPWKGECSYYHIEVDGKVNENAAWYYPRTSAAAKNIEDYIAFWKGVTIS